MGAMTLTLTDFLLARIGEDEARAYEFHNQLDCDPSFTCVCGYPERIAAECAAKRRIVNYRISEGFADDGMVMALRALASVYADHPDYRQEWRP